jgi:membrane protein
MSSHRPGFKDIWRLLKDSGIAWDEDNAARKGAALAYYTVFSLSPLLIIITVFASIGFGRDAARGHLVSQINGLIGTEGAAFMQSMLENAYESGASIPAAVFGGLTLILGATGIFVELRNSLNAIWRVEQKPLGVLSSFLRARLLSFAAVVGMGFLLLVSLLVSATINAFSTLLGDSFEWLAGLVSVVDTMISFVGITLIFALIFKFLPDAVVQWADVWLGAAFTSILFSLGKLAIGLYLGNSAVGSTFGAASSLAIILIWTFYSTQIFFFGAEFTRLYATRYGSKIRPARNAVRVAPERDSADAAGVRAGQARARSTRA